MKITSQRGLAVITGAAGGLGACFAKKLAQRGHNLLLVDRRLSQLQEVCDSLAAEHGIQADACVVDLCKRDEVERLAARLEQLDIELLVNNAGFGTVDYFVDTDVSYLVGQIDLHVVAPTMLTRAVLPGMMDRNRGNIINVSSLGGWFHTAGNVQYGSTKNYLSVFSQSLHQELRGTNVGVQALCPGFVRTGFHAEDSMKACKQRPEPAARMWMTTDEVVDCSLRSLPSRQVIVVPGLGYKIVCRLARMPFVQPIMQWITGAPRTVKNPMPAPTPKAVPAAPSMPAASAMQTSAMR